MKKIAMVWAAAVAAAGARASWGAAPTELDLTQSLTSDFERVHAQSSGAQGLGNLKSALNRLNGDLAGALSQPQLGDDLRPLLQRGVQLSQDAQVSADRAASQGRMEPKVFSRFKSESISPVLQNGHDILTVLHGRAVLAGVDPSGPELKPTSDLLEALEHDGSGAAAAAAGEGDAVFSGGASGGGTASAPPASASAPSGSSGGGASMNALKSGAPFDGKSGSAGLGGAPAGAPTGGGDGGAGPLEGSPKPGAPMGAVTGAPSAGGANAAGPTTASGAVSSAAAAPSAVKSAAAASPASADLGSPAASPSLASLLAASSPRAESVPGAAPKTSASRGGDSPAEGAYANWPPQRLPVEPQDAPAEARPDALDIRVPAPAKPAASPAVSAVEGSGTPSGTWHASPREGRPEPREALKRGAAPGAGRWAAMPDPFLILGLFGLASMFGSMAAYALSETGA